MSISRRKFLKAGAATAATLIVGVAFDGELVAATTTALPGAAPFAPNQWLRVDADGQVTIVTHKSEMGQGVRTSLPMIVADELGADWKRVRIEHAAPGTAFPNMGTSGSGSVQGSWRPLRTAAAAAREMLVSAAATRWNVSPSECTTRDGFVVHSPSARRVGFGEVAAAAGALPIPATPTLRPASEFKIIGQRVASIETRGIVRGTATYGLDVRVPGMRVATIARPPVAGATLRSADRNAALAVVGVRAVIDSSRGLAVIADNTWAAIEGRKALAPQWNRAAASGGNSEEFARALAAVIENGKVARREGDLPKVRASATRHMSAEFRTPFQAHAAMEPLNCVAHVRDGECEIWCGTQSPNAAQTQAAELLGIPRDKVTVHVTLLGGAFGRRIAQDFVLEAVELSRATKTPIQVVWTREDDLQHDMYNPAQLNRIDAWVDARGRPIGWHHRVADYHLSMFGQLDANADPSKTGDPWGGIDTPYSFGALEVTLAVARAPVATGAWRSVSYPAAVLARECFLDEIAHTAKVDPVALRLELLPANAEGERLRRVIRVAAERSGWGKPLPAGRARGFACNPYDHGAMVAQVAEVSVGGDGAVRVHRVVCAVDCGQVINRSGLEAQFEGGVMWALSAALKTEVTFANGEAQQRTFADYPVLRMREAPAVEVHVVESDLRPFGIGEPPVPAVAPAVLNAVFALTGKRIRQLPVRRV